MPRRTLPRQAQKGRAPLAHGSHEVVHGHWQATVELQRLGHVADGAGSVRPVQAQAALVWRLPQQGLDQRAFAAAVGADQGVHAAWADLLKLTLIEDRGTAQGQRDLIELNPRADAGRSGVQPRSCPGLLDRPDHGIEVAGHFHFVLLGAVVAIGNMRQRVQFDPDSRWMVST
jgi:hypothetical protein